MISSYLMGGLGNQLFQICASIALSMKFGTPFKFTYSTELTIGTIRPTYWDTFLSELKRYTAFGADIRKTNAIILNSFVVKETSFEYSPIMLEPDCKTENYILYGYYQSYRYFDEYFDKICDIIKLQMKQEIVRDKCAALLDTPNYTVSMHFRIGDYKDVQGCHNILSAKYYIAALKKICEQVETGKVRVIYFYEQKDVESVALTTAVLKRAFPNSEFIAVDHSLCDWEQMMLMSICDHNIIANSTYSWWGAYFNRNIRKRVVYPAQWFGPQLASKNTTDLFPKDWIKV